MSKNIEAYCQYMEKQALNPITNLYAAFSSGSEIATSAIGIGLALAALVGGGGGFIASKVGSPGKKDYKNVQRQYVRDRLGREVGKGNREVALQDSSLPVLPEYVNPKPQSIRL